MPHSAIIKDKDPCFEIDPRTRAIKKVSAVRKTIMQYDHNSERFTFKLPKMVEGHDMMECNKVEVHYINIDATTQEQNAGVYTVKDLQADADDDEKLKCSWLISQNATKLCGSLNFLLRFSCVAEDGSIEYAWNTEIFSGSSITSGLYNSDVIVEQYADVLEQWKQELEGSAGGSGGGAVASVNGKTGAVVLSASDVGAYTTTETDSKVTDLINSAISNSIYPKIEREVGDIDEALEEIINIKNNYLMQMPEPPINNGGEPDA